MKVTRRQFLATSAGLMAVGCTQKPVLLPTRPRAQWPTPVNRPQRHGKTLVLPPASSSVDGSGLRYDTLKFLPRSRWAKSRPIASRLNPMKGINRITVHHEGHTPVYFSDLRATAERLELIRRSHLKRMRAGDIGYHFIIDRLGQLWQGRNLSFQGAHVKHHNAHNLGVMVLGNFDRQNPTRAQMTSLRNTLTTLMRQYHVPINRIYTHQEISPTACPGRSLQPQVALLRTRNQIG